MDELHQLAKAYYRAGSPELKNEAQELFNSLDNDGDGRVDKNEFLSFMTEQGYRYMSTQRFFNELDTDGNHTLDFWEVMTLLYIFKSRRPFCDGCGRFIPATYFTCLQCPDYDLCISCYENGKSGHNHQFMDNYALLAVKKRADMNEEEETEDVNIVSHHSVSTYDDDGDVDESYTAVRAIVPAKNMYRKRKLALKAFQIALHVGNNCSIM
nr:Ca2+ sensor (EF-Hand superfamily) [Ipomoea batatas]